MDAFAEGLYVRVLQKPKSLFGQTFHIVQNLQLYYNLLANNCKITFVVLQQPRNDLAWRAKHICAGGWDARQHSCASTNGHLCWRAGHPPAQIVSLLAGSLSRLPVQIGICAHGCLKEPPRQTDSVLADGLTNPPAQRFFLCYNFIFCQFKFKFISH